MFIWDPVFVLTSVRHFPELSSVTLRHMVYRKV